VVRCVRRRVEERVAVLERSRKEGVTVVAKAGGPQHHEGTKEKKK
jgi:hypothetical protein